MCPATGWGCSRTIPRETTLCIALLDSDVMVGSISGKILVVKGTNIFSAIPAHQGAVNSLV